MFRRIATVFSALLILLAVAAPARAAEINEAGAAVLRSIFQRQIEYQQSFTTLKHGARLEFEGELAVEPAGEFYAVTLPYARIIYEDGKRLDIGMISVNASPHETPGQWKMSAAIPTPLVMFDGASQQVLRLTIGAQRFAGIWDEGLEYFSKLDADYRDIVIESAAPQFTHTIASLQARYDLVKDEAGKWSGPGFVTLKNIGFDFDNGTISGSAGEAKAGFDMDRYDPVILKSYREQLLAVAESKKDDPSGRIRTEHATAFYNMVLNTVTKAGNGFSSRYTVDDFELLLPERQVNLANGYFDFSLSGFLSGQVEMETALGYRGLKTNPPPPGMDGLQPENVNLGVRIEKLPFTQLVELGGNTMQSIAAQPHTAQLVGLSLLMKVPAILAQSGTILAIKDNFVSNNEYKIELNGSARADISAVNSFTAEAKSVFHGLDKVLARTQAQGANPENKDAQKYRDISETLEKLKSIAKVESAPEGGFVHVFEFIMNPQGQMLINGKDPVTLMMNKPAAPVSPAPEPEQLVAPPPPDDLPQP